MAICYNVCRMQKNTQFRVFSSESCSWKLQDVCKLCYRPSWSIDWIHCSVPFQQESRSMEQCIESWMVAVFQERIQFSVGGPEYGILASLVQISVGIEFGSIAPDCHAFPCHSSASWTKLCLERLHSSSALCKCTERGSLGISSVQHRPRVYWSQAAAPADHSGGCIVNCNRGRIADTVSDKLLSIFIVGTGLDL